MFTVVGLGNPDVKYKQTRHNIGQMVIAQLAKELSFSLAGHKQSNMQVATSFFSSSGDAQNKAIFGITNSYMNVSGQNISSLLKYFHENATDLLVIHDELDLPFGTLKLKRGGGEGGHNGLKSITKSCGTKDYIRLRVGIGRPSTRQDPADYVLSNFNATENKELPFILVDAAQAVIDVLELGLEKAQLRLHTN